MGMSKSDSILAIGIFLSFCLDNKSREYIFTDEKNGMVRQSVYSVFNNEFCQLTFPQEHSVLSKTVYFKKCLQGQTYRLSQNDCQGSGIAPDWNAEKFQFCASNDKSCDRGVAIKDNKKSKNIWIADAQKSPAAKSCAEDQTGNKTWELFYFKDTINFPVNFNDYFTLPKGKEYAFWIDGVFYADKAGLGYFNDNSDFISSGYQLKNTYFHVWCLSGMREYP